MLAYVSYGFIANIGTGSGMAGVYLPGLKPVIYYGIVLIVWLENLGDSR